MGAGFPLAAALLGCEEHSAVAGQLGARGRAAESAAHEPVRHGLRADVAGRLADDDGQTALQFRARVGRAEEAEAEAGERAGVAGNLRGRVEPLQRELMFTGLEGGDLHLGGLGFLDRLELIGTDLDAIDEEGDLRGWIAGRARGAQADRDDVIAVARGFHRAREIRRRFEVALLTIAAALREHLHHREARAIELIGLRRHRLGGDLFADGEEALQVDGGERQHVADVIEAVARIVGREVGGEILVEEEQVADRVVELESVEAADRHVARIRLRLGDRVGEQLVDGRLQVLDFGRRGTDFLLHRRHLARDDLVDDLAPDALVAEEAGVVLEGLEVEVALFLLGVVAVRAVLIKERLDILLEILGGGRGKPGTDDRPEHRDDRGGPSCARGRELHPSFKHSERG